MNQDDENDFKTAIKIVALCFIVIIGIITFFSSMFVISAGERGVLLTFGKPSIQSYEEGLHFKTPFITSVKKMSVRTQKIEITTESASKDLQTVKTSIAINYRLDSSKVPEIFTKYGKEYETNIVQPYIQETTKAIISKFTAEEVITKRTEVRVLIQEELFKKLSEKSIVVEATSITNFDFSDSFNKAIEEKVTAEQNKLKAVNDLERIKIEAEQLKARAIGEKEAKIAETDGQAYAIRTIQDVLSNSPDYVEWYKISKWDGVLPKATGSNTLINIE